MNLALLVALYGGALGLIVLYLIFEPRLQFQSTKKSDGHINMVTFGTGNLENCFPYTFRVWITQGKVVSQAHRVNVISNQMDPRLFTSPRGVMIAR